MKKEIENLIPAALNAVRHCLAVDENKTQVYEEYDGYAASLGAAIITSGLLPALAFYTDLHRKVGNGEEEKKKARRYKLLCAIAYTLRASNSAQIEEGESSTLTYAIANQRQAQKPILHASIALKLALRNFVHVKAPKETTKTSTTNP